MEELLPILGVLVGCVAVIAWSWYLANCFYEIACMKGFSDKRYFWVSFLFGIPGYLLVIALPDRKQERQEAAKPAKPLVNLARDQKPVGKWACPDCGNVLPGDVLRCKCGYARYQARPMDTLTKPQEPTGKWVCPDCGEALPGDVAQCQCGYERYVHKQ